MTENAPITEYSQVPRIRRNWFVILAWIVCWPAAVAILWTGEVYYMRKGQLRTYGKVAKTLLSVLAIVYTVHLVGVLRGPSKEVLEQSAVPLVTQIIRDEVGPDAPECKAVEIVEEVGDGVYKAKATLANGGKIDITVKCFDKTRISVEVPFEE